MSNRTFDFGIDLGTTNSAIAIVENSVTRIFKNTERQTDTTPSCVKLDPKLGVIVGHKAYQNRWDTANVRSNFKRLMGSGQKLTFSNAKKALTPEELSAEVLKSLKLDVQKVMPNRELTSAVICIPAAFQTTQCNATMEAARLAGIVNCSLLQEPIAAVLSYASESGDRINGYWLVYDFGGGTFDAALVHAKEGKLTVIEHGGDNFLGGSDFDNYIVDQFIIPAVQAVFRLPSPESDRYGKLRAILKLEAEQAKIELSGREETTIDIGSARSLGDDETGQTIELSLTFTRKDLAKLISPSVRRSIELCEATLERANLKASDLDKIILVGGATYIPFIREELRKTFGDIVDSSNDPMMAVAKGAALWASTLESTDEVELKDKSILPLKIVQEHMTNDIEEVVAVKIPQESPKGLEIQLQRVDGSFRTGRIGFSEANVATITVSLMERKINVFTISIFDRNGNLIASEPNSFTIYQGISVSSPPLSHSIGVEVLTDVLHKQGRYDTILQKGVSLPAKATKTYYSNRLVSKNSDEEAVRIIVYEGEYEDVDRDQWIGRIKIDGKKIKRDLPINSEIEVTIDVDESRILRASAYIPFLDQSIDRIFDKLSNRTFEFDDLESRLEESKGRISKIIDEPMVVDDERIQLEIRKLEDSNDIEEIEALTTLAKAGDEDAGEKLSRRTQELQARLDRIEQSQRIPKLRRELADRMVFLTDFVERVGNESDKLELQKLQRATVRQLNKNNLKQKEVDSLLDSIRALYLQIARRQDEFYEGQFDWYVQNYNTNKIRFNDESHADKLLREGFEAKKERNIKAFKEITDNLYELLSREDQEASQSGIKLSK
ncbi:MAG: Hsp70 family protein [Candidatus Kapaibacterium sp.]|jgi:molecular chaperone DnaK